jgi:hypothetical protein
VSEQPKQLKTGGPNEVDTFGEVLLGPPHMFKWTYARQSGFMWPELPVLSMYCQNCKGPRNYRGWWSDPPDAVRISNAANSKAAATAFQYAVAWYQCQNCQLVFEQFVMRFAGGVARGVDPLMVRKVGQDPNYFVRGSRLVEDFIGPDDLDLYRKGRRAEGLGLGIAAFAYYRRIIENNKDKLLDRIIEVARETDEPNLIEALERAKGEWMFSSALKHMAPMVPKRLKIGDHSMLSVLHDTFSQGLHALTDEACLKLARNADTVLGAMLESIGQVLADKSVAQAAIHELLNARQSNGG